MCHKDCVLVWICGKAAVDASRNSKGMWILWLHSGFLELTLLKQVLSNGLRQMRRGLRHSFLLHSSSNLPWWICKYEAIFVWWLNRFGIFRAPSGAPLCTCATSLSLELCTTMCPRLPSPVQSDLKFQNWWQSPPSYWGSSRGMMDGSAIAFPPQPSHPVLWGLPIS